MEDNFFYSGEWFDKKRGLERELTPAQKVGEMKQEEYSDDEEEPPKTGEEKKEQKEEKKERKEEKPKPSSAGSLEGKVLTVNLLGGRNLASKDSNGFSDPYVVAHLLDKDGKQIKSSKTKSKVIKKTLNPQWDSEFLRLKASDQVSALELVVWDEDKIGKDEFMGQLVIPVADLLIDSEEKWVPLEQRTPKDEISGDLHFKHHPI